MVNTNLALFFAYSCCDYFDNIVERLDLKITHVLDKVTIITDNVKHDVYDAGILDKYTVEEFDDLNLYIKHNRDNDFTYAGMEQFRGKYLVQNRRTGELFESPQMLYMMVSMTLFGEYDQFLSSIFRSLHLLWLESELPLGNFPVAFLSNPAIVSILLMRLQQVL